jgi:hypothetical protein
MKVIGDIGTTVWGLMGSVLGNIVCLSMKHILTGDKI